MAKALTVRTIEAAKPGVTRKEIPDGLIRGLYLVIQPSGAMTWAARYRHRGQPRKLTLGPYPAIDLKAARKVAGEALAAAAGGGDPAQEKQAAKRVGCDAERAGANTLETVITSFIKRYARPNTRTWPETKRILEKHVLPAWTGRRLSEIGRADIHEILDSIVDDGKPILANRTFGHLQRMCNWAVERGIITTSPCHGMKPPAAENSRDRILTDAELRLVWEATEAIGWPFGGMVRLLILTAQRRDEVSEMTWHELDIDVKAWIIARARAKNDTEHSVPLSDAAVTVIKSLPRIVSKQEFVFTTTGASPVSGFSRAKMAIDAHILASLLKAAQEAGQDPQKVEPPSRWTLHDLRRTAASGMARLGQPVHVVEAVLNHRSGTIRGVARVYNRYSYEPEKRAALEAWGQHVERLVKARSVSSTSIV